MVANVKVIESVIMFDQFFLYLYTILNNEYKTIYRNQNNDFTFI